MGGKRQRKIQMHRELLNAPSSSMVDHINGDTLDNRRSNIRLATNSENQRNRGPRKDNKLGLKGVIFSRGRYRAGIKHNRVKIDLGTFNTPQEAHAAYISAALRIHGEFAKVA